MTLRQAVLESNLNGSLSRSPSPEPFSHVQEQRVLQDETIAAFHGAHGMGSDEDDDERSVDEIVVDRVWYSHEHDRTTVTQSEHNHNNPDNVKAGSCHQHLHHHGAHQHRSGGDIANTDTDHDSLSPRAEGFWGLWLPLTILRYRAWPATLDFFSSRFYDEKAEDNYRKEIWFSGKVGFFDVIASGIGTDDHRVCFEMLVTGSLVLTVLYHQLGVGLRTRTETICIGG